MQKLVFIIISFAIVASAEEASRRNQIEELFIWKVSDELKLNPAEEKKISELIHKTNQQKIDLNKEIEQQIQILAKSKSDKEIEKTVLSHKKTIELLGKLPVKELEQAQKILGPTRLAKYVVIKSELTHKIKSLLTDKMEKEADKKLPAPKIIEE